jgi:hypothetical protein
MQQMLRRMQHTRQQAMCTMLHKLLQRYPVNLLVLLLLWSASLRMASATQHMTPGTLSATLHLRLPTQHRMLLQRQLIVLSRPQTVWQQQGMQ